MPKLKGLPVPRTRLAPRLYTIDQYCDVTNKCRATAYNQMRAGELPYVVDGGRRKIPVSVVEALTGESA